MFKLHAAHVALTRIYVPSGNISHSATRKPDYKSLSIFVSMSEIHSIKYFVINVIKLTEVFRCVVGATLELAAFLTN